jgi:hypothetical protein
MIKLEIKDRIIICTLISLMTLCTNAFATQDQHCSNGITQWNQLSSLNIQHINLQQIQNNNGIRLSTTKAPVETYVIREHRGRIYAETPVGRAYVEVCQSGNNGLISTAAVLGIRNSVRIETQGRNQGIIHANGSQISFTAE